MKQKLTELEAERRAEKRAILRTQEEELKKHNKDAAKKQREIKQTKDEYKDVSEKLQWEGTTNFLLRIGLGAFVFYVLFWSLYEYYRVQNIFFQLANAMLYSTIASIIALILSYAIIKISAKRIEGEKLSYRDVNKRGDLGQFAYESLAIMFNGFFTVFGLLPFLISVDFPFWMFAIVYIIAKSLARGLAYVLGKLMSRKAYMGLGIFAAFVVIVFSALVPLLTILSFL